MTRIVRKMSRSFDSRQQTNQRIDGDPDVRAMRDQLEALIAEMVPDPANQWKLLGFILTEFEPLIYQVARDAVAEAWQQQE
jgi:hypothetical protein